MNFTRFLNNEPSEKYLARLTKGSYVIVDGRLETSKREVDGKTYNNMVHYGNSEMKLLSSEFLSFPSILVDDLTNGGECNIQRHWALIRENPST